MFAWGGANREEGTGTDGLMYNVKRVINKTKSL